ITEYLHGPGASDRAERVDCARSLRSAGVRSRGAGQYRMAGERPHFIVFANEKGGTGKSTTAVHSAVGLQAAGRKVAALDLDTRQRTLARYLENRGATRERLGTDLPMPLFETFDPAKNDDLDGVLARLGEQADIIVIDTPGRDDPY